MTKIEELKRCAILQDQAAYLSRCRMKHHKAKAREYRNQARRLRAVNIIARVITTLPYHQRLSLMLDRLNEAVNV